MNKLVRGLITIERSTQIAALIGVVVFVGYLGVVNYRSNQTPTAPPPPTIQK